MIGFNWSKVSVVILKERLTSKIKSMKKDLEVKQRELEKLKNQLEKEYNDIKKLEGLSLSSIFAKITGTKEDKLEKEEREYFTAKMKYDECLLSVNCLIEDIESAEYRIEQLGSCKETLRRILKEKRGELKEKGLAKDIKLIQEKEREINSLMKEYVEIREATDACAEPREIVREALGAFKSAKNWGTYDMIGGGMFSSMAKHDKVYQGKSYLSQLSYSLKKLENELNDITIEIPIGDLNISSLDYTFDVFFDNIFTDFSIQRKIQDAYNMVLDAKMDLE